MNRDRFISIVDAYGAEPRRWPEGERAAALALAAGDEAAAARWRAAETLDEVLDESRPLAPSAALRSRVIEAAPRRRPERARAGWWASGAGLAAAGAAGLAFGAVLWTSTADVRTEAVLAEAETYDSLELGDPVEAQL